MKAARPPPAMSPTSRKAQPRSTGSNHISHPVRFWPMVSRKTTILLPALSSLDYRFLMRPLQLFTIPRHLTVCLTDMFP